MKKMISIFVAFLILSVLLVTSGWDCGGPAITPTPEPLSKPPKSDPDEPAPSAKDVEEPPSEQGAEEPSSPEEEKLTTSRADTLNDAASCFTNEPVDEVSKLDLEEVGYEFSPKADEFTFWHSVVQMPSDGYPFHGGTGIQVEGTPRDESSEWWPDTMANIYINYVINEEGLIGFFLSEWNPTFGWEQILDMNVTGEIKDRTIFATVPAVEIIPEDFDPSTGKIYVVAVTFDGSVCDFWGQDENGDLTDPIGSRYFTIEGLD